VAINARNVCRPECILACAALVLALTAGAAAADDAGLEPQLRDAHLPPVAAVAIRRSGATSPASSEPAAQCRRFRLGTRDIRAYLGKAAEVTEHDYLHLLDWSPCETSGTVTFKNGMTGTWTIQQYRAGSLRLGDGRIVYLYCPRCRAKAFAAPDH